VVNKSERDSASTLKIEQVRFANGVYEVRGKRMQMTSKSEAWWRAGGVAQVV
jgi:hypothetical protein